jgi:MFS transporter, DHA2 family, multidrug resistance protein
MKAISDLKASPKYKWNVLILVIIGTFMAMLDSSIVNVSLPDIIANFGSNITDIQWIMTAYMLAFAALMPLTAWLRDRVGYKYLFICAIGLFTAGSLLCGMAWSVQSLIMARVIQALGGGAIMPTGMAMLTEVFSIKERGQAFGYYGLGVIIGPMLGPTLGGYLTHAFTWRSVFLVNLPVGIICMLMASVQLAKDKPHHSTHKPFDFWGFLFFIAFLVPFLLGISKGEDKGWTSPYVLTCAVISMLGFIGFILVETQVKDRIIDLSLFKIPVFTSCMIVTLARSVALFGGTFLLPVFIQRIMGYNEITSGLIMLPSSIAMAIMMPFVGKLSDKMAPRIPTIVGIIFLIFFMFMYRNIDVLTSIPNIIIPTIIRSAGMILLIAPIMTAMMNSIPQGKAGMASSMNSIIQQVGGSIGIAIFTTVQVSRTNYHMNIVAETIKNNSPAFKQAAVNMMQHTHNMGLNYRDAMAVSQGILVRKLSTAAALMSFQDTFFFGAILMIMALPLAFLLPAKIEPHIPEGSVKDEKMKEAVIIEEGTIYE